MSEVVLVRPGITHPMELHWSRIPPLGLAYLTSALIRNKIDTSVVDGKLLRHRNVLTTVKSILASKPRFLGLSAMTMEYPGAVRIAKLVKKNRPDTITILGGIHANALPAECLSESDAFDYVMTGESESSFVNLIKSLQNGKGIDSIPGLFFRDGHGKCVNSVRSEFEDVSRIPFPAWDFFPRTKAYPVLTERGCPYRCVFCSHNMGQRLRSRPLENVKEEIRWLYRAFAPREIYFEDETFGLDKKRTEELLEWLVEFNKEKRITFKAQTRVDQVSSRMLVLMKRAGFDYLELGIESGDAEVLRRSKKGITLTQAEEAVRLAKNAGLKPWVNFIIGLPGETEQTVRNMIEFAVKLNPDWISVALIVAYPGSEIYQWAVEGKNGYKLISSDWSSFDKYIGGASIELEKIGYTQMKRLQIRMYLETYIRNMNLKALFRLIWESRDLGFT